MEKDTFGPIEVPADRLWGRRPSARPQHFQISGERMPLALLRALALVKKAAALGEHRPEGRSTPGEGEGDRGRPPTKCSRASTTTSSRSRLADGSGTQTNMNVNEVLANRATELLGGERGEARKVHPNDDVNKGQSSNDVFPTAMHVAAARRGAGSVIPVAALRDALARRPGFKDIVKIGRTHLQDATPLTLGQEFSGYVAQLDLAPPTSRASCPTSASSPSATLRPDGAQRTRRN